ncbi:MAG: Type IV secretory pathway VirB4 component-like protein, partial [Microgenomates group bacterium GW2011_GWA2_44_7]
MPNQISVQNNSSAQPLAEPQPVPATATPIPKADAQILGKGITSVKDIIAPSAIEVDFNHIKITNTFFRTLFVAGYPRFVAANWLSPLINFDRSLQISMFIYPVEGKSVLDDLRRKIAEMEAETASDIQRGRVVDPAVQAKLEDAYSLQEQLVKGIERFFQFSLYVTISATSVEELDQISRQVTSTLGSLLIVSKSASLQMEDAFKSTLPTCTDLLMITRNMDTTSLATTFPFTSSELTANEGILYGINEHNGSLIIFDRFTLENANSVIFAKAGAGKSYLVKLEALRYLLFGAEIIVIDPESEYKILAQAVGGEFINFGFNSPHRINPFDLSMLFEEGENELGNKILSLHTLFKIIMGNLNPSEEAALDRALVMAYKMKGITPDPDTQKNEPPLMEDLYKAFLGMEEPDAKALAQRIEKFVKGSFVGIFDRPSNVDIQNKFTVFSLRDVEETLRPIAMYIILDYVWTKIRRDLKKRLLVVDEAWYLMRYPDAAHFLHGIAKRARKYYLGLSTITQDVEDFLSIDQGKAIIT